LKKIEVVMLFVSQAALNDHVTTETRFGQAGTLALCARRRSRHRLEEDLRRALRDLKALTEENDALRKSAEIWIRMYEGQLARADRMAAELKLTAPAIEQGTERPAAPVPARA
jgi:hypothetical protein